MTRLALAALLSLSALACSPSPLEFPADFAIDPSFSAEETDVIIEAVYQWRRATNGAADLRPVIGTEGGIVLRPATLTDRTLGLTDLNDDGARIGVDLAKIEDRARAERRPVADELRDTVLHEMGHAFGLSHASSGLMVSEGYGGGCVDSDALSRFCDIHGCPSGTASTCASEDP